jgi:hypothetical protein
MIQGITGSASSLYFQSSALPTELPESGMQKRVLHKLCAASITLASTLDLVSIIFAFTGTSHNTETEMSFTLGIGSNIRKSPYFDATVADGVQSF